MTEPPVYDVPFSVEKDGGHHLNPAESAVAAHQAALGRAASIVSAPAGPGRSPVSSQF